MHAFVLGGCVYCALLTRHDHQRADAAQEHEGAVVTHGHQRSCTGNRSVVIHVSSAGGVARSVSLT